MNSRQFESIEDQEEEEEGLAGLQDSRLDSVTGGGSARELLRDLQIGQPDKVSKMENLSSRETKESAKRADGATEESYE